MSRFVEECLREWNRLGVPAAVSSEMAADLAADLAEAEADGASPEEVLGNGVFDPRSFAASWATSRGVVPSSRSSWVGASRARWAVIVSGGVSIVAGLVGLVMLGHHQAMSVAAAAVRRSLPAPFFGPPAIRIGPHSPSRAVLIQGPAFQFLGLVLLVVGLLGIAVTLWLWRPWSNLRRHTGGDGGEGPPSYL